MSEHAVVLAHGIRSSASQWDLQVPTLRAAGYQVLTPDLPGHGSRIDEPFTLDGATAVLTAAIERGSDGGRTVHLIGSSLGGMLAIAAAAEHEGSGARCSVAARRGRLGSLTVCGSAAQPTPASAAVYGRALTLIDLLPDHGWAGAERIISLVLGRRGAHAYLRGGRPGPEVVAPAMRAVASLDLVADLRRITAGVTILSPRYDQLRSHERQFAAAARDGRLEVLPYGTHMVNLSRPERFNADLLRILHRAVHPGRVAP